MSAVEEIERCLSQAIQLRTVTEIVATMGTKVLTLQNFQLLIKKFNKNIINKEVEEYYYKVLTDFDSRVGITQEIFEKLVENLPKPKRRQDVVMSLIEGIQQKKASLERIYKFFDYDGDGKMQLNEMKELLEYLYPEITEEDIKILMKNNNEVQFSFENIKTLLSFEQNMNAEIVIVKDKNELSDSEEDDEYYDEYGMFKGNQEEFFDEQSFSQDSPFYESFINFKNLYFKLKENKTIFVDPDFKPDETSLGNVGTNFEWKRLTEIWKNAQIFQKDLYHSNNELGVHTLVSPRDIKQGSLGDCYFLSSLGSIASKHPDKIFDLFQTPILNPYGIYGVWLCIQGVWKLITLDDYVPVYDDQPAFSGSDSQEMWVILLEKAWAKLFGSYANIVSGDPREVIASITGGPTWCISSDESTFIERLKQIMNSYQNYIVCAGTYSDKPESEMMGLVRNHAYSVLNFRTIKLPSKEEVQLIQLKNPYGNDQEWNGDWSDKSPLWTEELKDNVLQNQEADGIFFMCIEDFRKHFENAYIGFCNPYFEFGQITIQCQRRKSAYILVNIKKDGEYYFSAYQKSQRMFKQQSKDLQQLYEYSEMRLILSKMNKNNSIQPLTYKTETDMSFNIFGRLQKGQYILQLKANWVMEGWDQNDVPLASYGEDTTEMKFCQKISNFQQASILFEAKEKRTEAKPLNPSHPELVVLKNKSLAYGYPYLYYQNLSKEKTFNFNLVFEGDIKLKKPHGGNLVEIELKPGQDKLIVYKFLVKGTKMKYQVHKFKCVTVQ
ncbi:unnamed protein product (macronuclear) [Paramecium tetraurelia]|uniref:Calpain catalytic domain-containing protein n=1 Tax=Paramecium tetraurelia TaxID=5888 RepID=A0BQB7_PARTE|nr:uncharacterized protein GSPATT00030963001 [Paramecium tetraurelia]CAK60734.1 unnamed protein product [Paramecium tetraurelia]|eukprot:XP_001428132.1 hypothetical protein (macronuclear) [Paramecium tetraurelia strain d4-2]